MHEISRLLNGEARTVTLKPLSSTYHHARVANHDIIRPFSRPFSKTGGLAILFGNLAPGGAVVKSGAVSPEMMKHTGPAGYLKMKRMLQKALWPGRSRKTTW